MTDRLTKGLLGSFLFFFFKLHSLLKYKHSQGEEYIFPVLSSLSIAQEPSEVILALSAFFYLFHKDSQGTYLLDTVSKGHRKEDLWLRHYGQSVYQRIRDAAAGLDTKLIFPCYSVTICWGTF